MNFELLKKIEQSSQSSQNIPVQQEPELETTEEKNSQTTGNNYSNTQTTSSLPNSQQINTDSQPSSMSDQDEKDMNPQHAELVVERNKDDHPASQNTVSKTHESSIKSHDPFDDQYLTQCVDKDQEDRLMISNQLNKSVVSLQNENKNYKNNIQVLEEIEKNQPTARKPDQSDDEDIIKYNQYLQTYIEDVALLKAQPVQLNLLQSNVKSESLSFQRNKYEMCMRIQSIFLVSFQVSKEDFGLLIKENNENIEKLKDIKLDWENQRSMISKLKCSETVSALSRSYSKIFGLKDDSDTLTELEQLMLELNSLKMECQNTIADCQRKYEVAKAIISKDENQIKTSSQKTALLNQSIVEVQSSINVVKNDIQANFESLKNDQTNRLARVRAQIAKLEKELKESQENSQNEQTAKFKQLAERLNSIDNQYSGGLGGAAMKAFFHYIFVVDESGSFYGPAHDQVLFTGDKNR